ncbi:MAG: cysteine desulfurase family protein [Bdellovibrionota bacterium]
MEDFIFFDSASTTRCYEEVAELLKQYACVDYGNPSSSHVLGQRAAKAIKEAREYFADIFNVEPRQIIFTSGGTESDNLAISGVALGAYVSDKDPRQKPRRLIASAIEHPAVTKCVQSLTSFGFEACFAPVNGEGRVIEQELAKLLIPETVLVSIISVNNIMGAVLEVEKLARLVKEIQPEVVFHTDGVQAFGKIKMPVAPSSVDLVSISAHKICGPKGVGALVVLNPKLLDNRNRLFIKPLIYGGEQEGGLRAGTQSAGLISGFHVATKKTLSASKDSSEHVRKLNERLKTLLTTGKNGGRFHWNSPQSAVPQIISLAAPGVPAGPLARLLEELGFIVSTGSACQSSTPKPEATLVAMGLPSDVCSSSIRISLSMLNSLSEIDKIVSAVEEAYERLSRLQKGGSER